MIDRAIETFAHGYCFTRSFTHPYLAERLGPLWVLRDGARSKGDYRREEFISHGVDPEQIHRIAGKHARSGYCICALHAEDESDQPLRDGFKALGYRLNNTESMMVHPLKRIPRVPPPVTVQRVTTRAMADQLATAARSRQILPEHLCQDAPQRSYAASVDGVLVGWVSSVVVGDTTWCSNMFVKPAHRRRGIARSMLCKMLRDDRAGGATTAVLLASHAGAKLYPVVGYRQIGTLMVFTPRRK